MATIAKGTLLYRGIDCPPENVRDPLRVNKGEGILWCATDSQTAQTYIPDFGGLAAVSLSFSRDEDIVRPDDGILTALMEMSKGPVQVHQREWPVERANPLLGPISSPVVNGTFGRPVSWSCQKGSCKWADIRKTLLDLGYDANQDFLWVKSSYQDGKPTVERSDARLDGALAIFTVTENLRGLAPEASEGSLLDPEYHRTYRRRAPGVDFSFVNDFCQTKRFGNVGHTSVAVFEEGTRKLALVDVIGARHFEWEECPEVGPSPEELAWSRQRDCSVTEALASRPVPSRLPNIKQSLASLART